MGYHHSAVRAKAAAPIDYISNRHLELSLGASWYEMEHSVYGIPFFPVASRMDVVKEVVQIIKAMLNQGTSTSCGGILENQGANCHPMPLQKAPRIWVSGRGEKRSFRIAAKYADYWNAPYISPAEFQQKAGVLDMWCETENRSPSEIIRSVMVGFCMRTDGANASVSVRNTSNNTENAPENKPDNFLAYQAEPLTASVLMSKQEHKL